MLDVLEKGAAAVDASAAEIKKLRAENAVLRQQTPTKKAAFSSPLLLKMARTLEQEGLLPAGVDAQKAAALIEEDPDRLADLVTRLTTPMSPEGRGVKAAAATTTLPDGGKLVRLGDREVVDRDGWLGAIS